MPFTNTAIPADGSVENNADEHSPLLATNGEINAGDIEQRAAEARTPTTQPTDRTQQVLDTFWEGTAVVFPIGGLVQRYILQLLIALEEGGISISSSTRWKYTWAVYGITAGGSVLSFGINYLKRDNDEHPAAQEYVRSVFSSAIAYMLLDLWLGETHSTHWDHAEAAFVSTSVFAAIASLLLVYFTRPDTSRHRLQVQPPVLTAEQLSVKEDFYNSVVSVAAYMPSLLVLSYAIKREIFCTGDVELNTVELIIAAATSLFIGYAGYTYMRAPRLLEYTAATCNAAGMAAFSYMFFSGILGTIIQEPCDDMNMPFRVFLSVCTAIVAGFVGLWQLTHNQIRGEEWHSSNMYIFNKIASLFCCHRPARAIVYEIDITPSDVEANQEAADNPRTPETLSTSKA